MVSRICEELPRLSAEDIVWILEKYLPKPQATEEDIQKALARRPGASNQRKVCAKSDTSERLMQRGTPPTARFGELRLPGCRGQEEYRKAYAMLWPHNPIKSRDARPPRFHGFAAALPAVDSNCRQLLQTCHHQVQWATLGQTVHPAEKPTLRAAPRYAAASACARWSGPGNQPSLPACRWPPRPHRHPGLQ